MKRYHKGEQWFWMVKLQYLAPYYGIKMRRVQFKDVELPPHAKIVRVAVRELDERSTGIRS